MPAGKKFEDITENEKHTAFETWVAGKTARKAKSNVRRQAMKALIDIHTDEYNVLLKKLGGAPTKGK